MCKIVERHFRIWNRCEKCIEISTNMPSFRSVIVDLDFQNPEERNDICVGNKHNVSLASDHV